MQTVSQTNATSVQVVRATPVRGIAKRENGRGARLATSKRKQQPTLDDLMPMFHAEFQRFLDSIPGVARPIDYRLDRRPNKESCFVRYRLGDRQILVSHAWSVEK